MVMGVKRPTAVNIRAVADANACHTLSICRCNPATPLGLEVCCLGFELVVGGWWLVVSGLDFGDWCLVFGVEWLEFGVWVLCFVVWVAQFQICGFGC